MPSRTIASATRERPSTRGGPGRGVGPAVSPRLGGGAATRAWIDSRNSTHVYASILLAHWREARAHDLFLRLSRLPDEFLDPLFGDMVTECFPPSWCAPAAARSKAFAPGSRSLRRRVLRGSALEALSLAVPLGLASREEVLEFYGNLFASPDEASRLGLLDELANAAADLYPRSSFRHPGGL